MTGIPRQADVKTAATGAIPKGILYARIMHARFGAKPYVLRHKLWYLHLPLSAAGRLKNWLIGYNRRAVFTLRDKDYGHGAEPLDDWIRHAFSETGTEPPEGDVVLLTLPRVLGFGFNPVSFWLCHDKAQRLIAVLAEVNNTFGDRHCYLVRRHDGAPIAPSDRLVGEKVFHVSPFLPVDGEYAFRFIERADELSIQVDLLRANERVLTATINGRFAELNRATLLKCFFRYPLPTVQVLGFIHVHAMRLWMHGIKPFARPEPPAQFITSATLDKAGHTRKLAS